MADVGSLLCHIMGLSRGIMHDRVERRKFILWVSLVILGMFALGNWPLAGWLEEAPWRFLAWWGLSTLLAVFLFLLGLYDFLATMREVKGR